MCRYRLSVFCRKWSFDCRFFLVVFFSAGLLLGIFLSHSTDYFSALMRRAAYLPVSIVGLCTVVFLPFLFTAGAVFVNRSRLLLPLAFCKAFSFGFCCMELTDAFGTAGWMLRILLMFSDILSIPVLLWLWLRCMDPENDRIYPDFMIAFFLLILIGSLDYLIIAPFLALVISV